MKKLIVVTLIIGLVATATAASATSLTFSGTTEGGTGSASMDIAVSGNVLNILLKNTSPIAEFNPGITGFGFDLANDLLWHSWELKAMDKNGNAVTIGSSNYGMYPWKMGTRQAGVTLDYLASTGNMNSALYNPTATDGFGGNSRYFTDALLVMTFGPSDQPVLTSTFVRMQNVGEGGEGSLKLFGFEDQHPLRHTTVPEPGTMMLLGAGLAGIAIVMKAKRR